MSGSVVYNLEYLKNKGFFKNYGELEIDGKTVIWDKDNYLAYAEVEDLEELKKIHDKLKKEYVKFEYFYYYIPRENKVKVFKRGCSVAFTYSGRIKKSDIKKSKEDTLNKFSPENLNVLFDTKDVMDRFYNELWQLRLDMAKTIKKPIKDKDKLLVVQHFIDRLVFFYFLCQLGIVKVKYSINGKFTEITMNKQTTKEFFNFLIDNLNDSEVQKLLNGIFFEGLGNEKKVNSNGYVDVYVKVGEWEFDVSVPYLNGELFREKEIPTENNTEIKESEIEFTGIKELIKTLNDYNWVIGDYADDEESVDNLTPEVLGHVYEKFVVGLENIGEDIKLNELRHDRNGLKYGRKKIGAYYTPEEITSYISENTIIPYLFDKLGLEKYNEVLDPRVAFDDFVEKASEEELKKALKVLNDIRVLDPACGSGHFLVSAGNLLFDLKECICNKLAEKFGFERELDDYAEVKKIIVDNLYGVDISETAVEIAKLRLWLWLVSQLKDSENIEPLPNLEYNIKCGNSLIGWVDEPLVLPNYEDEDLINKKNIENSLSKIYELEIDEEERKIIDEVKKLLGMKVEARKGRKFDDIYVQAFYLLYKIYRTSYGDKARILKEVLDEIKKIVYNVISPAFLKYINSRIRGNNKITETEFEKLKPFHWRIDFGWIIKSGGFDVIIGNPPYGNILSNIEKQIIEKAINYYVSQTDSSGKGSKNAAALFINLGANLLRLGGYLGFIVPKSICYIEEWEKTRKLLLENVNLKRVVDNSRAFEDVKLEMATIIFKKDIVISPYVIVHKLYLGSLAKYSSKPIKISKEYLSSKRFITDFDETNMDIYLNIVSKSINLGDIAENYRGLNLNKYVKDEKLEDDDVPIIRGKDIKRFGIKGYGYIKKSYLQSTKFSPGDIIAQRIVAHIENPKPHIKIMATLSPNLPNVNTVTNIKLKEKAYKLNISPKYLLAMLNSKIINWFVYKYIYVNAIRSMDFIGKYADETPILIPPNKKYVEVVEQIVDYILFLENVGGDTEIKDFLIQMLDTLIYFGYTKTYKDLDKIVNKLNEIIIPLDEKSSMEENISIITTFYKNAKKDLGNLITNTNIELTNLGIV